MSARWMCDYLRSCGFKLAASTTREQRSLGALLRPRLLPRVPALTSLAELMANEADISMHEALVAAAASVEHGAAELGVRLAGERAVGRAALRIIEVRAAAGPRDPRAAHEEVGG